MNEKRFEKKRKYEKQLEQTLSDPSQGVPLAPKSQSLFQNYFSRESRIRNDLPKISSAAIQNIIEKRHKGRIKSKSSVKIRCCSECEKEETFEWRTGPNGSSLCNACGLRYMRHKKKNGSDCKTEEDNEKQVQALGKTQTLLHTTSNDESPQFTQNNSSEPLKESPSIILESGSITKNIVIIEDKSVPKSLEPPVTLLPYVSFEKYVQSKQSNAVTMSKHTSIFSNNLEIQDNTVDRGDHQHDPTSFKNLFKNQ